MLPHKKKLIKFCGWIATSWAKPRYSWMPTTAAWTRMLNPEPKVRSGETGNSHERGVDGSQAFLLFCRTSRRSICVFLRLSEPQRPPGKNRREIHRVAGAAGFLLRVRREWRSCPGNRASQTFQPQFQCHILYFYLWLKKWWSLFKTGIKQGNFSIPWKVCIFTKYSLIWKLF